MSYNPMPWRSINREVNHNFGHSTRLNYKAAPQAGDIGHKVLLLVAVKDQLFNKSDFLSRHVIS